MINPLPGEFRYISKGEIGSTYNDDELLTKLYLENRFLRQLRKAPPNPEGFAPVPYEQFLSKQEFAFARRYFRVRGDQHRARHLVLANEYPREGREYANGFVHRRIKKYHTAGVETDVMAFGKRLRPDIYEYDGVNVLTGYVNELLGLLSAKEYDSISVHFLNAEMWKVLKASIAKGTRIYVYVHGYEADNWIRRPFQLENSQLLHDHIARSVQITDFWNEVAEWGSGIDGFIFVSDWWRDAISEDLDLDFITRRSHVIHNVIDEELFKFVPKDQDQRFKILWVRSAHTKKYAADVAVEILQELKKSEIWGKIEAKIIGDGAYFELFENAFSADTNVCIERRFASQAEIAELHQQYGFFLVPTRYDSQGVARDEAMSSGLIPITNPVSAVPEFVDDRCAVLGGLDDAVGIAEKVLNIMREPLLFSQYSARAAKRVRTQCGAKNTVAQEVRLMIGGDEL